MAAEIIYNGAELIVPEGRTVTLACAGNVMKTDVVISAVPMTIGVRLLTSDGCVLTDKNELLITTKEDESLWLLNM